MEEFRLEFIDFLMEAGALKFGDFTLKSGRKSPFFMNAGIFKTGSQLQRLGEFYARAVHEAYGDQFDVFFGPAYKGIPLCVAASMAYWQLFHKEIRYCANRKEVKDHGDAGILLGSSLQDGDRVVILEDVTTSGKSIEETYPILKAQGDVRIAGMMVMLDRGEKGLHSEKSALKEVSDTY
ncbi:MAG: orotate phosphoribosyltransferase, partial [Lachnospiraceae bacterium]|nr:orotate phosphoribosyltransferase [Lachnospiraceae bacterium]